jgi:hypothetical protein
MSWAIWMRMHCISLEHSPRACMVSGRPLFFSRAPAACWRLETSHGGVTMSFRAGMFSGSFAATPPGQPSAR